MFDSGALKADRVPIVGGLPEEAQASVRVPQVSLCDHRDVICALGQVRASPCGNRGRGPRAGRIEGRLARSRSNAGRGRSLGGGRVLMHPDPANDIAEDPVTRAGPVAVRPPLNITPWIDAVSRTDDHDVGHEHPSVVATTRRGGRVDVPPGPELVHTMNFVLERSVTPCSSASQSTTATWPGANAGGGIIRGLTSHRRSGRPPGRTPPPRPSSARRYG